MYVCVYIYIYIYTHVCMVLIWRGIARQILHNVFVATIDSTQLGYLFGATESWELKPLTVHPVSVRRFSSFRTQPLENLSHYLRKKGFLSNPAPGEKYYKRKSCYGDRVHMFLRQALADRLPGAEDPLRSWYLYIYTNCLGYSIHYFD